MNIPLHFQVATPRETSAECAAETLDVSSRGMCIETDMPPHIGDFLLVRMRLPEMIMGWRVPEWRITGHVVHFASLTEPGTEPGKFSVGVQFHYYEAVAPSGGVQAMEGEAGGVPVVIRLERP